MPNLLRYLQTKKKNVDYSDIIAKLENAFELPEYEDLCNFGVKKKHDPLPFQFNMYDAPDKFPDAVSYLMDRGISLQTAKKLDLGFHTEAKRITFPVKGFQKEIYGYTARTILPDGYPRIQDYYFPKSNFILGVEHWIADLPVIIVEGLFGFAHLHEVTKGKYCPFNIGAIMGSSISPDQLAILIDFGKPVYCLLDNDEAGRAGMLGRRPHPDWSPEKRQKERDKGMVFQLKDHVPTHMLKWPMHLVEGKEIPKTDPDQLTYDDLFAMIAKSQFVIS